MPTIPRGVRDLGMRPQVGGHAWKIGCYGMQVVTSLLALLLERTVILAESGVQAATNHCKLPLKRAC